MTFRRPVLLVCITSALISGCATTPPPAPAPTEPEAVEAEAEQEAPPPERTQATFIKVTADEGFTVMMPSRPEPIRQKVTIPAGDILTAAWSVQDPNGAIYSISTADYPEKIIAARPASAFLNEGKDGLLYQLKGTIVREEPLTLQGYPGTAYTISSDNGEVMARNFLVGPRLYTMLVLYNPSIGAETEPFLTSLELVDPPPAITPAQSAK